MDEKCISLPWSHSSESNDTCEITSNLDGNCSMSAANCEVNRILQEYRINYRQIGALGFGQARKALIFTGGPATCPEINNVKSAMSAILRENMRRMKSSFIDTAQAYIERGDENIKTFQQIIRLGKIARDKDQFGRNMQFLAFKIEIDLTKEDYVLSLEALSAIADFLENVQLQTHQAMKFIGLIKAAEWSKDLINTCKEQALQV